MQLGINLINFGPSANPSVLAGWAEMAERLGYHSLLTSDHIAVTSDVSARYPAPFYEPASMLGWLAGVTDRIAIGTTVSIVPYRNPLETARSMANVDQLSGGRLIFGVGVGWAEEEFAALGLPFRRRGAMTDEYLDLIVQHWTCDELNFDGQFVSCESVDTAPRPVQEPHPPLWVGGASSAALRRAVRVGGAWHPIRLRPGTLQEKGLPRLSAAAEEMGRPTPDVCPRIMFHLTDSPVPDDDRFLGHGTVEQLRDDLGLLQDLGCAHVILDAYSPFDDAGVSDPLRTARDYQLAWDNYEMVAADVFDLDAQSVR